MKLIGTLVAALWVVTSFAFAQIDPEAQVVLDRHEQRVEEALADRGEPVYKDVPIDTLEVVTTLTIRSNEFRSVATAVVDRSSERLASAMRLRQGDDTSFSHVVYDDGTLRGVMVDGEVGTLPLDDTMPTYETLQATLAGLLEAALAFMADPDADTGAPGFARYDGPVSYGDVLEGEQLTLDALPYALSGFLGFRGVDRISVVYAPDGSIIGQLVELSGETTLTVYESPLVLPGSADFATYALGEGETTLLSETSLEMTYNEPLDEAWFELPETAPESP